jgi:hypothetical protein
MRGACYSSWSGKYEEFVPALLLKKGALAPLANADGNTALHHVGCHFHARSGSPESLDPGTLLENRGLAGAMEALVTVGHADIEARNAAGQTPRDVAESGELKPRIPDARGFVSDPDIFLEQIEHLRSVKGL